MTEIPSAADPERSESPERQQLEALATRLTADLAAISELRNAILRRALGEQGQGMYDLEEEMFAESEAFRQANRQADEPSVYEAQHEAAGNILSQLEHQMLQGGTTMSDMVITGLQSYTTTQGEGRSQYTEYKVRGGIIVGDHHDTNGEDNYQARLEQIEREAQAGLNGQPLDLETAQALGDMVDAFRLELEWLLAADDAEFFRRFPRPQSEV